MPIPFSAEQVTALAPDSASVKAGRGLTNPAKWPTLGCNSEAAWGECQGSGSKPYQTQVDFTGPGFKCSCPSRKFPCKHGLGLLFMAVDKPGSLKEGDPPDWVGAWLQSRRDKAEKKAATVEAGPKAPADPEAAAKRVAKRLTRMQEGAEDLTRWMTDQLRHGIATWPQQPFTHWQTLASRMVDHQMPALEGEIRALGGLTHRGDRWPQLALHQLGRLNLSMEALQRFDTLPAPLQADLRVALGWSLDKEEAAATGERLTDDWAVVGQVFEERERLWERRTWLQGRESGRTALVLDFSHGNRAFEIPLVPGTRLRAELLFYPSASPQRALLTSPPASTAPLDHPFATLPDLTAACDQLTQSVALNPWATQLPLALAGVVPIHRDLGPDARDVWGLQDAAGACLSLEVFTDARHGWELLALSGGRPLTVFLEWRGAAARLLSCWQEQEGFHAFQETAPA